METVKTADQGGVWLAGRRSVCGRRLSLRSISCTSAVRDMNSAAAAAVMLLVAPVADPGEGQSGHVPPIVV